MLRIELLTLYFSIHVHPNFRNLGIGTKLLNYIKRKEQDSVPLQTSLWETSFTGNNFLKKRGFKEIRRTFEPKLSLSDIKALQDRLTENNFSREYSFLNISQLKDKIELIDFVKLAKKCYEHTHTHNPPGEKSLDQWESLIYSDTVLEGSFITKKNNKIIAFALLHENNVDTVDLGWRGVDISCLDDEKKLILELTNRQIEYAIIKKKLFMNAEIDTTDKWASILLDYFPFETASTWITYQWRPINDA